MVELSLDIQKGPICGPFFIASLFRSVFPLKITTCVIVFRGSNYGVHGKWTSTTIGAGGAMTKSELIELIADKQNQLSSKDVELAVKTILEHMSQALSTGERIEIRGFGSFSLHYREPRRGRNPKTGDAVELTGKYVPHFKPGKELRERVNMGLLAGY